MFTPEIDACGCHGTNLCASHAGVVHHDDKSAS